MIRLLGGNAELKQGLEYFQSGRVESLLVSPNRKSEFTGKVKGSRIYSTKLRMKGPSLESVCDCPTHERTGACKHAVAVAMLIQYLYTGKAPGARLPSFLYFESIYLGLEKSLKSPESPAAQVPSNGILIRKGGYGELELEIQGSFRPDVIQKMGIDVYTHPWSRKHHLPAWPDFAQTLSRIAGIAEKHEIPVYFQVREDQISRISGNYRYLDSDYILNINPQAGTVLLDYTQAEAFRREGIALNSRTRLLENGDLLALPAPDDSPLAKIASPEYYYYFESRSFEKLLIHKHEAGIPLETFNEIALAVPIPSPKRGKSQRKLHLNYHGELDTRDVMKVPEIPVETLVSLQPPEAPYFTWTATIDIQVEGLSLALDGLNNSFRSDLLFGHRGQDKLFSTKGRFQCLINAARQLLLEPSSKERNGIIRGTANNPQFALASLKGAARKWLRQFEKHWVKAGDDYHLLATGEATRPWVKIKSLAPLLAQLILGLCPPGKMNDVGILDTELEIPIEDFAFFLRRAVLVCQACGARLRSEGKPVRNVPVDVSLAVTRSENIDWFELRTEVRCGQLTIPQEDWERLIRGELLLQKGGEVIIPELSREDAINRIQALLGSSGNRVHSVSGKYGERIISQLEILDWLSLRQQGVQVELPAEIEDIYQRLLTFTGIKKRRLSSRIKADLRPYQKAGFDWLYFLYENRFGACLADDMGLGKTLQAIAFLAGITNFKKSGPKQRHLVVVPPSLMFNWTHEIQRFCPSFKIGEYIGANRGFSAVESCHIVVTTYDIVRRDIQILKEASFEVVVFDEVQLLKNVQAARTRAAQKLQRRFTLCLTGTPMENHVGEYYSVFQLAVPGIFGNYREFMKEVNRGYDTILNRAKPFILRRTKHEILKELPPKVENDVYLDMTEEQKEYYTRVVGEVRAEVMEAYQEKPKAQASIMALSALLRLRQICISPELLGRRTQHAVPKIDYLIGKGCELHDEGYSAIIFSQFTKTLDLLESGARDAGLSVLRLDGSVPASKRKQLVNSFQNSEGPQLFLISLRAGGVGLNLTRAQYVFHADPWWNPAVENQASDRAHRIGQTETVFIQRVLMRHSIEEKMMVLKRKKQKLFNLIVDSAGTPKGNGNLISRDDFQFLLGTG